MVRDKAESEIIEKIMDEEVPMWLSRPIYLTHLLLMSLSFILLLLPSPRKPSNTLILSAYSCSRCT